MKQKFPGYDFNLKSTGKKYYSNVKEVKRFCFDKWKEGKTQREIGEMLGLDRSTVSCHITSYCKNGI